MTDKTSLFGAFPKSEEAVKAADLQKYIAAHSSSLFSAYDRIVHDRERRSRVRELAEAVQGRSKSYLADALDLLYYSGNQRVADTFGLMSPLYNTGLEYQLNAKAPWTSPATPRPIVRGSRWSLLGQPIGFPIGVPASALTGSPAWVELLASSGYNVITYKTVRSREQEAFGGPNWAFLPSVRKPIPLDEFPISIPIRGDVTAWDPTSKVAISTANSFGVPSHHPDVWRTEISSAREKLQADQMLIVSVMGDHYKTGSQDAWIADFVEVAVLAAEAGATAIELNVSCPNTLLEGKVQPPLCYDLELTRRIAERVRQAVGADVKIVLKLSYLPLEGLRLLVAATEPFVDAYAGINTIPAEIVDDDGRVLFEAPDEVRTHAGVSGLAIREFALDFVRSLALIRLESGVHFDIIGMGGVSDPDSFRDMYEAGATVVQSATGVFEDVLLAQRCVEALGHELGAIPYPSDPRLQSSLEHAVEEILAQSGRGLDQYGVASRLAVPYPQTYQAIERLLRRKKIKAVSSDTLARYVSAD